MKANKYAYYLHDLGEILKELAFEAKKKVNEEKVSKNKNYALGYLMGMYEVISIMQQQAELFEIKFNEIGLEGINPEQDILLWRK